MLPDFENRAKEGKIRTRWNSRVTSIDGEHVCIRSDRGTEQLRATRVYVMTGFAPDLELVRQVGVPIDTTTGIPAHDPETLETTVPGIFIAGVVVAGFDANKVFIENGRFHGDKIVAPIPSNLVKVDSQSGMAVAPNDTPRTMRDFEKAVSDSIRESSARKARMDMLAAEKARKEQASLWSILNRNWLVIMFALAGIALATWQLLRR